ncbi:hypothetical protein SAMN05877753_101409 [Bacillus oleivorans]|uniref:Polymerase nucleotidyl transferase domain-containing protein n=1 Tax=Bacillus oleivorans TaxID=1448271 RepID=A0A285CHM0_9BACI|nr:nucleotidyltransferase domain-containing protein [Bacillus oleivorans]SNX67094.1 hypothetical protein SAMN05877753_101409 [Bacillus oleivorans]
MFVVLIGSVARNDFNTGSDIDICRIKYKKNISRKDKWPSGPINYIDYDDHVFNELFNSGSLFIYHILYEGILLAGDKKMWEKYKSCFKLKQDFTEEIKNIVENINIINNIKIFGNKYLSLYSNLYTLVKNFSIFHLANKRIYVFNKENAMNCIFEKSYNQLLIDAYNYFERGIVNNRWNYDCSETAIEIITYYQSKVRELYL